MDIKEIFYINLHLKDDLRMEIQSLLLCGSGIVIDITYSRSRTEYLIPTDNITVLV